MSKEDTQILVEEHYSQLKTMLEESEIDFHLDESPCGELQFIEVIESGVLFTFNEDGSLYQVKGVE